MLNLKEIGERIQNPNLVEKSDIEQLSQLCERYPYSQIFPLLYLKALASHNDISFEDELNKHAYKISNRHFLYDILHQQISEDSLGIVETIIDEVEISATEEKIIQNEDELIVDESTPVEEVTNTITEDTTIDNVEDEIETSEDISTSEDELVTPNEDDLLDKQLRAHTIASSYSLELEETDRVEKEDSEEQIEEVIEEDIEIIFNPKSDDVEQTDPEPSTFTSPVTIDSSKSFSGWLHANSNYTEQPSKIDVPKHIGELTEEEKAQIEREKQLFEAKKEKKEFFSPTKKAKESLDEKRMPVSETLAKIFEAQGNYPKAIYAYEQLMLIIPEKKSFFADRIKKLEKKLNK